MNFSGVKIINNDLLGDNSGVLINQGMPIAAIDFASGEISWFEKQRVFDAVHMSKNMCDKLVKSPDNSEVKK